MFDFKQIFLVHKNFIMSQLNRKYFVKKINISNLAFLDDTYLFHLIYDGPVRELSFPFIEGGKMDGNPDFRGLKKGGKGEFMAVSSLFRGRNRIIIMVEHFY